MIDESALDDLRARLNCADLAREFGAKLRGKGGRGFVGSCPLCGGGAQATRFEADSRAWVCAVCPDGGDVIKLAMAVKGIGFPQAVEFLGGARQLSGVEKQRLDAERAARDARREREAGEYREKERKRAWDIWSSADGLMTEFPAGRAYLAARGILDVAPMTLRFVGDLAYFHGRRGDEPRNPPRMVHRGPAMLAAIQRPDGHFQGVHQTWLTPDGAAKAAIVDPDTGAALPAKKVRGGSKRGLIKLAGAAQPARLFIGEGVETVLSVLAALRKTKRARAADAFWTSVDLGNLGGPAAETVPHPTAKMDNHHARRVPGPEPAGEGWLCPESVGELVTLGDGDSEEYLTRMAHARAARRYGRPGRIVRAAFAAPGLDFNDMLRAGAPSAKELEPA